MTRQYFRLDPLARMQEGSAGGCIYDLPTGEMIRISSERVALLSRCAGDAPVDDLSPEEIVFLDALVNRGIGAYHADPCVVEPMVAGRSPFYEKVMPVARAGIGFIELGVECNFNCVFCRPGDNQLFRRTGCKRWGLREQQLSAADWDEVIGQMARLGVRRMLFTGGEPLLDIALLERLVTRSRDEGISEVVLLTNGALIGDNVAEFLADNEVMVRVQLMGSSQATYGAATGDQDAYDKVVRGLVAMRRAGVTFSLSLLVTSLNEHEVAEIREAFVGLVGPVGLTLEYLYEHPDNQYLATTQQEAMLDAPGRLVRVDLDRYCELGRHHNCFGRQVAVTADGYVLPCPMARSMAVGDWLSTRSVAQALCSEESFKYRGLTKGQVPGCAECELRFGCDDCRPLEYSLSGEITGMATCSRLAAGTNVRASEDRC